MKPTDRALDIVVVGLGQAGGNIAAEFSRLGYRAIALNTAHSDLSALASDDGEVTLNDDQRVYIGLDGYDGAGADLNYGRECIRENATRIRIAVERHSEDADIVLLTAGMGGGTGSALSELIDILQSLELPIVTLTTLPGDHESGIAKVNAARGTAELVKRRTASWIFADNQRLAQSHGGAPLDKYFERINEVIVAPLDAFNRMNDRQGVHALRTLDGEDFRRLLLSNGVLNYAEVTLQELTVESITDGVREALQTSSVMPSGFSLEEVSYIGVALEAPSSTLAKTPFSFVEHLSEMLKNDTGGGAIYLGMYRVPGLEEGTARLRLLAASQSLPSGIQAIVNDAKREGGTLRDKLRRAVDALDLGEIEDFDLFRTHTRKRPTHTPAAPEVAAVAPERTALTGQEELIDEKPNGQPLRTPVATTTPAPPPEVELHDVEDGEDDDLDLGPEEVDELDALDTDEEDYEDEVEDEESNERPALNASSIPPSGAVARAGLDTAAFSKLADAFLETENTAIRSRIARRLEEARGADDALARYHSGHAIKKIERERPGAFEAALGHRSEPQAAKG